MGPSLATFTHAGNITQSRGQDDASDARVRFNHMDPALPVGGGASRWVLPGAILARGGPVAQLGERYNRTVEVRGSNPLRSISNPSPKRDTMVSSRGFASLAPNQPKMQLAHSFC